MRQVDWGAAKDIFADVLEAPPERRANLLDELCRHDAALRAAVDDLLSAHVRAESLLQGELPPSEGDADRIDVLDQGGPTQRIGPFELIAQLGRGAFGVVYRARQHSPVEREVALKLLRRRGAPEQLAAFRAEQRALARMEHPGIARLLEVGASPDGRPFVALELVQGEPITGYCQARNLDTRSRLRLFVDVCRAIHHAHQRAVLHRDIKPSNVLVTEIDGRPVPKVIDFGIAQPLTLDDRSAATHRPAGTPRYMSPEQLRPGAAPDVRSDVFSLGVLLCELLAGAAPPVETGSVSTGMRPSLLLDSKESPRLRRALRGDLDEIVARATAPEPAGRYDSASALADDVDRYLGHWPITAGPNHPLRRFAKFTRRHRVATTAAALAGFGLLCGALAALVSMRAALVSRDAAVWSAYVANVAAALSAFHEGEYQRLRSRLAAAPAEHRGWEWRFLTGLSDGAQSTIPAHDGMISSLVGSPDGTLLATGAYDGIVRLWDATTGEALRGFEVDSEIESLAFHPEGQLLAAGGGDGVVRVWNLETGRLTRSWTAHRDLITDVAFTQEGLLATGSPDGAARLWNIADGELICDLESASGRLTGVQSSNDGLLLATWNDRGDVQIHHESGEVMQRLTFGDVVVRARFTPDDRELIVAGGNGRIVVWGVADGLPRRAFQTPGSVSTIWSLAISPDGTTLAAGQIDRRITLWSLTGDEYLGARHGHEEAVSGLAFRLDGQGFWSASRDRTIRAWSLGDGSIDGVATLAGHEDHLLGASFSPDESLLATASRDGTVRLWCPLLNVQLATLRGHERAVYDVKFSPDGKWIATAGYDHCLRIWNSRDASLQAVFDQHGGPLWTVAFSPDGRRLAAAGDEGVISLWDIERRELLAELRGHTRRVIQVAFSPDGRRLASASRDTTARIWDLDRAVTLHLLNAHSSDVFAVLFSHDGSLLYTGSRDQSVRVWNAESGAQLDELSGHGQFITSLSLSPDGSRLAAGSWFGEIVLWDVATREMVASFRAHDMAIRDVTFSPSGRWLASASYDRNAKLYDAAPPEQRRETRAAALAAHGAARRWLAARALNSGETAAWITTGQLHEEAQRIDPEVRFWVERLALQQLDGDR